MKHPRLARLCALSLAALLLPSCAPLVPSTDTTPPSADTHYGSDPAPDSDLADYQARINELSNAVLTLKEESFIAKIEYEARIEALLSEIATLKAHIALLTAPDGGGDLPVGGTPADTAPVTRPTPQPPATMAFHYEIRDGRAVILAYLGDETEVTIPAAIEGYPVTAIAEAAFRGTAVVSVKIPYSVTEIGWFAFANCQSLTSLTLSASVESIGYGAFDGCPHLTVICPADSYAARYAKSFGLPHKEES